MTGFAGKIEFTAGRRFGPGGGPQAGDDNRFPVFR
jgi:hypothetical protein